MPRMRRSIEIAFAVFAAAVARADTPPVCKIVSNFTNPYVVVTAPTKETVVPGAPETLVTFRWTVDWARLKADCPNTAWRTALHLGPAGVDSCPASGTAELTDDANATARSLTVKQIRDALAAAGGSPDATLSWFVELKVAASTSFVAGPVGSKCSTFRIASGFSKLVVTASPSSGWPSEFVVRNDGGGPSEPTSFRAHVALSQADVDAVAKNCSPRFVDFDDVVPALQPGASSTIRVISSLRPDALAAWNALHKPAYSRAPRPAAAAATPTALPNPVQQTVTCRYDIKVLLGRDPAKTALTVTVTEYVPLK